MNNMVHRLKEKFVHWWGWSGTRPWLFEKIETYYYNVKWTIVNYFKYAKIVARHRPWDSTYILDMMQFQLKELCHTIETYGNEVDEERLPKIADMKRAIEILDAHINDSYPEKCGYIQEAIKIRFDKESNVIKCEKQPGYEDYNEHKVFIEAKELEAKEWDELFTILKRMKGWWD